MIQDIFNKIFGSYNERQLKKTAPLVEDIKNKEKQFDVLSDKDLKEKFSQWKNELTAAPEKTDDLLVDVFAGIKCASKHLMGKEFEVRGKMQKWDMVHFDVQLLGGIILHQGKIAEMKTGEGKTLVCTLPVILNALTSRGVHVVTVNDYLAQRDSEWMAPLYEFCGLSTGVVINEKTNEERHVAYGSDITYGTNNEFGFDYLRDNMAQDKNDLVQRELYYAIVDEVDSILIDEARTPLIISAPAEESTGKYRQYSKIIRNLVENDDYIIDFKLKAATLTEQGIAKLERILNIKNIFTETGFEEVHHIENALKANVIFEIDRDYVVRDGQVLIVDEFTGRLMPGRRYSDGLHQALEAKEELEVQRESKTLATVTFQNYFRLYKKLAGMTGTAETEAEEFAKIYKLDTIAIPTNKNMIRMDFADRIFKNEHGKFKAVVREVQTLHAKGQPVLIGTINIDKSEILSELLHREGIPHEVLNAKQHEREAEIVAKAGQRGSVTIATNMAGRGTDIKLGEGVQELGGLAIIGTERHEARRIDNQLRGRSGRQGDPGFSQFYISMRDDLMKRFGGEKMAGLMDRLQIPDDEPIENGMISKSVENAQKKIEGFHFDARKHVVQYDDVMNIHREKMYGRRRKILYSESIMDDIETMIQELVEQIVIAHALTEEATVNWDINAIVENINGIHSDSAHHLTSEQFKNFTYRKDVIEEIFHSLLSAWNEKKKMLPPTEVDRITKYMVLHSIDELWLNHINEMTHLRDRVALAGYAQKDPVIEYKRESFEMFKTMIENIRKNSVANLFRIQMREPIVIQKKEFEELQTNAKEIMDALQKSSVTKDMEAGRNFNANMDEGPKLSRRARREQKRRNK